VWLKRKGKRFIIFVEKEKFEKSSQSILRSLSYKYKPTNNAEDAVTPTEIVVSTVSREKALLLTYQSTSLHQSYSQKTI
jgi:hypothetical protein